MISQIRKFSELKFSSSQIIVAMPLLWFLHTWLDNSVSASYEEVLKTELKRTRTIKIQKHLFQGFKSMSNPSGFEDTALTVRTLTDFLPLQDTMDSLHLQRNHTNFCVLLSVYINLAGKVSWIWYG